MDGRNKAGSQNQSNETHKKVRRTKEKSEPEIYIVLPQRKTIKQKSWVWFGVHAGAYWRSLKYVLLLPSL
jgi:hypothetical protein